MPAHPEVEKGEGSAATPLARPVRPFGNHFETAVIVLVAATAFAFMITQGPGFAVRLAQVFGIWAILAVSLNLLISYTGLLSVAHVGFFGVVASLFERAAPRATERARAVIASVGLEEKHESLAMDLSYGQRKLLEIARALAMDVKIFLFDEPFAGLFPQMLVQVKSLLQELKGQGRSIIFVSHNMDIVRELSDRVVVMDSGTLLAEGDVDEVLAMPEVVEAYLGT